MNSCFLSASVTLCFIFVCWLNNFLPGTIPSNPCNPDPEAVHVEVDHRRGVESHHLAEDQSPDDGYPERTPQFVADTLPQRQGERSQKSSHGRHHDRPESEHAGRKDGFIRRHSFVPLRGNGKVDHHDAVLLHDADQQDNADDGDQAQIGAADQHGRNGSDPC